MGRGLGLEKNKKRIEVEMPTKTREGCVCLGTRRHHVTFRHIRGTPHTNKSKRIKQLFIMRCLIPYLDRSDHQRRHEAVIVSYMIGIKEDGFQATT